MLKGINGMKDFLYRVNCVDNSINFRIQLNALCLEKDCKKDICVKVRVGMSYSHSFSSDESEYNEDKEMEDSFVCFVEDVLPCYTIIDASSVQSCIETNKDVQIYLDLQKKQRNIN